MKDETPELTIVIPTVNEEEFIGKLLGSLLKQDYTLISSTPVYIADFKSTDRTMEIARGFQGVLNISIIGGGFPSVGRNRGAELAKTKYVLFIDADSELRDPTTIRKTLAFAN